MTKALQEQRELGHGSNFVQPQEMWASMAHAQNLALASAGKRIVFSECELSEERSGCSKFHERIFA